MRAKLLLLFAMLASTAAFGQGLPAPPTGPYTDKDSGFVFPATVGTFRRGTISHLKDSALWVDYGDVTHRAQFTIRIIVRPPMPSRTGRASCKEDVNQNQERVKRWPYFAGFSPLNPPEFAGYTSTGWAEEFGPPKAGGTGYDFYSYCSQSGARMVIYGFQRAKGIDVKAQEIAFIRGVKPPGA
jgi:hypothetical protein